MKTIVFYYCLRSIVLLNFTMYGGALFRVCTEARTRVLTEMSEIRLHKNEVGGYAYNDANTLITQIERVLKRKMFEDSANRIRGLASAAGNALNNYKSTFHQKNIDVLLTSRASAEQSSIKDIIVGPEINTNSDTQDESDRQNVFRLTAIGVKEGIAEGITNIVGRDVTNPILRTTDEGRRTKDDGRRTTDEGRWTKDNRR